MSAFLIHTPTAVGHHQGGQGTGARDYAEGECHQVEEDLRVDTALGLEPGCSACPCDGQRAVAARSDQHVDHEPGVHPSLTEGAVLSARAEVAVARHYGG